MSVLGVVLALIGGVAALIAGIAGIFGGIPAVVLGLLACVFGFLSWKKTRKGIPAIFFGFIAVVLAVALTVGSISGAKYQYDQVKAHPEKAPTLAKYIDDAELQYGFIGLMMVSKNPEEDKLITEEVLALLTGGLPKTAAAEPAEPVTEAEAST